MTGHLRIQIVKTQWLITGWWKKKNKKTFEKNFISLYITISVIPKYFCPFYQFSDIWENIAFIDVALASLSLNTFYTLGITHSRTLVSRVNFEQNREEVKVWKDTCYTKYYSPTKIQKKFGMFTLAYQSR